MQLDASEDEVLPLLERLEQKLRRMGEHKDRYEEYLQSAGCTRTRVGYIALEASYLLLADAETAVAPGLAYDVPRLRALDADGAMSQEVPGLESTGSEGPGGLLVRCESLGHLPVYVVTDAAGDVLRIEIDM